MNEFNILQIRTEIMSSSFSVDAAIGVIKEACLKHGYILMITADHGNAEQMYGPNKTPFTAHTCNRGKISAYLILDYCRHETDY